MQPIFLPKKIIIIIILPFRKVQSWIINCIGNRLPIKANYARLHKSALLILIFLGDLIHFVEHT